MWENIFFFLILAVETVLPIWLHFFFFWDKQVLCLLTAICEIDIMQQENMITKNENKFELVRYL